MLDLLRKLRRHSTQVVPHPATQVFVVNEHRLKSRPQQVAYGADGKLGLSKDQRRRVSLGRPAADRPPRPLQKAQIA